MTTQNENTYAELKGVRRNSAFFDAHYAEYREKYPDHWIAIHDGKLVGTSPQYYDLIDDLKAKGFSFKDTLIDKVESKDILWFLPL